ncbi:MAG: LLM class flavin-dependent oxidoreductase [Hyphomicrobiaceae bacterium]|nr:LLM class flavin-dependent oxidoreductase [Hyphomicrobiaceae bacterium]
MKLGVYLNAQHPDSDDPARRFAETVEQVRLIRKLGYDSIWGGEHHVTDGYHYFPLLPMMQRLAAEAEGLAIGTNIVLLPLHNPVELAETCAFLDVISGGGFILGVGLGYREEEFAVFGVPMKERVSRLEEGVEIIRRLWSEDKVTFKGRHWTLDGVTIRPRPLQSPRPSIIVASQIEKGIERAARISDGWTAVPVTRVEGIAKQTALVAKTRAEAGLPPAQIARIYEVSCARDEEAALARSAKFLLEKYAAYASWGLPGLKMEKDQTPIEQLRGLAANRFGVGTPAQVVGALVAQHKAGIGHVGMRMSWPGMAQEEILAGIELVGREVLPEVRRRIATETR